MRYSKAWAVAAVAAALVAGAGCVTRSTYNHDLAIERSRTEAERLKTAAVQEKLDQANQDVKKAWDTLAQKAADYTTNQKAADDARRQLAGLRQQIDQLQNAERTTKAAADKAKQRCGGEAEEAAGPVRRGAEGKRGSPRARREAEGGDCGTQGAARRERFRAAAADPYGADDAGDRRSGAGGDVRTGTAASALSAAASK